MTINYTTLLGLAQPVTGTETGQWGDVVNDEITSLLEDAVANAATFSVTSGNVTLTTTNGASNQARMSTLIITGSPGTTRNVIAPSQAKIYQVINQSDGAVVIKGSATTGVTIAAGATGTVVWNGSDFVEVNSTSSGRIIKGNLQVTGNLQVDGNTQLGNATSDTLAVTALVNSNLLFTDATYDIGASGATRPRNLYLSGLLTMGGALTVNGNSTLGDASGDSVTINAGTTTFVQGTANGVTYLNGSKVLTTGSALVFDGTNLGVGASSPTVKLQVEGAANSAALTLLRLNNSGTTGGGPGIASRVAFTAGATALGFIQGCNFASGAAGLQFSGDGTNAQATLDSVGNIGLGVTPSTGDVYYRRIELGKVGCGIAAATASLTSSELTYFTGNAVATYTGGNPWTYGNAGSAGIYAIEDGIHKWSVAGAGSAGGAISFSEALTLDTAGNFGVGVTNPASYGKLAVNGNIALVSSTQTLFANKIQIVSSSNDMELLGGSSNISFKTGVGNTERVRVHSSGGMTVYGYIAPYQRSYYGGPNNTGNNGGLGGIAWWYIGTIRLDDSEAATLRLQGTAAYGAGQAIAGESTIHLRGDNSNGMTGYFYGTTQGLNVVVGVAYKATGTAATFDLWVQLAEYQSATVYCDTNGVYTPDNTFTGSATQPSGSTALSSYWTVATGGTERARVDSTGRLGVGTNSYQAGSPAGSITFPTYASVQTGSFGRMWNPAQQIGGAANAGLYGMAQTYLAFYDSGWKSLGGGTASAVTLDEGIFAFANSNSVGASGSALTWTTRFMCDTSGNLLVGRTSSLSFATARVAIEHGQPDYTLAIANSHPTLPYGIAMRYTAGSPNNTSAAYIYADDSGGTQRFSVRSNGGIYNYSGNNVNLSDRREKTNFAPAKAYLETICAIPVQTFNYVDQNMEEDPGTTLGVVAQDVQAVAPELVTESNWGTKESPKMRLSVYQTDLQYALMKALQELKAEFDAYKATHP